MRTCRKCGLEKPFDQFRAPSYECKECASARNKVWRAANAEKHRAARQRYYEANKDEIVAKIAQWGKDNPEKRRVTNRAFYYRIQNECIAAYGGHRCNCCGETEPKFLSIDHVNNNGADHRREIKSLGGLPLYQWLRRNKFPEGFQVLCMNCNTGRYRNGGVCPHKQGVTTILKGSRAKRPEAHQTPSGS